MVNLSDYLNYLSNEVIKARKKADEQAIELAKEYAKDDYLRFFSVPRYAMPKIKLSIPIKINEIDSETKYDFKLNENLFISEVNEKINKVNNENSLNIPEINTKTLKESAFVSSIKKIESKDQKFIKNLDQVIESTDFKSKSDLVLKKIDFSLAAVDASKTILEKKELSKILKEAYKNQHKPISTKINQIFIDPDTSKSTDKDKVFLTMDVEIEEENIRINELKDDKGNTIEEIVFE